MTKIVYLASPIDNSKGSHELQAVKRKLAAEYVIYDPASAWLVSDWAKPNSKLQAINMAALRHCDGLFVYLEPVFTVGTILELIESIERGTPSVVYGPSLRPSWAMSYLGVDVYTDFEEASSELRSILA